MHMYIYTHEQSLRNKEENIKREETKTQLHQSKIASLTLRFCTEETSPPKHLVFRFNREQKNYS